MNDIEPRSLEWIGTSLKDMRALPLPVRRTFGYALYAAQSGERPPDAKPLKGYGGAGVLEVIEDYRGDTYRAVYTVRFAGTIHVLHVFQKKSKHGIETPKADLDLIRERLRRVENLHAGKKKGV
jgi:phage-related protein